MHFNIAGFIFIIGGFAGALGVDPRIAWGCVAIAGLALIIPL